MDLGLEKLIATTNAEITKKTSGPESKEESKESSSQQLDTDDWGIGSSIVENPQGSEQDSGSSSILPMVSPVKRPMTSAVMGGSSLGDSSSSSIIASPPPIQKNQTRRPQTSASAPNLMNSSISSSLSENSNMSPARAHLLPAYETAQDMTQQKEKYARWLRKEGVKASCHRLGINIKDLKHRSLDFFRREPNRPFDVPPYIQMQRFKHHEQRRVAKVALVLTDLEQQRDRLNGKLGNKKKHGALNDDDMRKTFSRTIVNERRRLRSIESSRTKAWGVLMNENHVLHGIRNKYKTKLGHTKKREKVMQRRKQMQQEQALKKSQAKASYAKKVRQQADDRFNHKITLARGEVMRNAKRAEERRRRVEAEKKRLVVDQDLVEKRRQDIKDRLKNAMAERAHRADQKRAAADRRNRLRREEMRKRFEQERERRALKARDQAEQVQMQRKAMLAKQAAAQEERMAWKKRMGLLKELEIAIAHERQLEKKNRRKMEWERKQSTIFLRDQLPGPGEYDVPTTIGKGKGAAKWGDSNPKSDVEWAIYYAKDLPGPGQYHVKDQSSAAPCARFSQFTPKSDVDWLIYYASQKPGPGQYEPKSVKSRAGVTFSKFTPKGEIDKIVEKAREMPGPSDYSASDLRPVKRRSLFELKTLLGADIDVEQVQSRHKIVAEGEE